MSHGTPGERCKRPMAVAHMVCELDTPCPLHDGPPRKSLAQECLLTLRYTIERIAATLAALTIAKWWLQ